MSSKQINYHNKTGLSDLKIHQMFLSVLRMSLVVINAMYNHTLCHYIISQKNCSVTISGKFIVGEYDFKMYYVCLKCETFI